MTSGRERTRCRERLLRLSRSSLDCESVQLEAIADLRRVIGFDRWCWPSADPETLLPLSGFADHDYGPMLRRALELEYSGEDFAAKHDLARRASGSGCLSFETGGDLARSPRWEEVLRPVGIGDVGAAACRDPLGCWGWIEVYRGDSDRRFEEDDLELLTSAGRSLGVVLRRRLTTRIEGTAAEPSKPGVIVLTPDLDVLSTTESAHEWIDALPAAGMFAAWDMLPAAVYPVATLARSRDSAAGAHALERAVDGRWLMIEAAPLEGDGAGYVAVTLRKATPKETFDILARAHALTRRERDVVTAVCAGLDTNAITQQLLISRHTVQDHLKSIFEKIGVHSRRELLATFNAPPHTGRAISLAP